MSTQEDPDKCQDDDRLQSIKEQPHITEQQNQVKGFSLAILCAIFWGSSHTLNSLVSAKYGSRAIYPLSFCLIPLWFLFHTVQYFRFRSNQQNQGKSYFSKANSSYFELVDPQQLTESANNDVEDGQNSSNIQDTDTVQITQEAKGLNTKAQTYRLKRRAIFVPLERALVVGLSLVLMLFTFKYAALSEVNSGIIASVFSTAVIFTSITFYFLFDQKLTNYDLMGITMIIICAIMIGFGSSGEEHGDQGQQKTGANSQKSHYLLVALLGSTMTGLSFTLNSLDLFVLIQKVKFPVLQLHFDGGLILGLILLPFFIDAQANPQGRPSFSAKDILIINLGQILQLSAVICFSFALRHAKAGPLQGITNCKNIVQTILAAIITGRIPTTLQLGGLIIGFLGVFLIVIMKKQGKK